jgi:DNA polymerase-4/protein ImuB
MSLQQALSLYSQVELILADLPHYRFAFNKILDWLETKSPLVEGADLGKAYLCLDGLEGIYGDCDSLVNAIKEGIPFPTDFGIADGKFLAYLAALRSRDGCVTLSGDLGSFLRDLSCDVLPVSARTRKKLHCFGLHTLGQVSTLSQGPLQAQFGTEGKLIWELAMGYDHTPLYPRRSEEVIEESIILPSVTVSLDAILIAIESLLVRAFDGKGLKGRAIRSLALWAQVEGSGYWERSIQFKEPATNVNSALSRIKHILLAFPLPGPAEELGLKLTGLSHQRGKQGSLFSEVRAREHLLDDIKQLELRLGSPQVFRIRKVEPWSRIPERRYVLVPLSQ